MTYYGLASLSCALPIFLAVVGTSLAIDGLIRSLGQFVGYALGVGSSAVGVLIAAAAARLAVASRLPALILYIRCHSAMLMIGAEVDLI